MKIKVAITCAFLLGISAMVKSQSTSRLYEGSQVFVDQKMIYPSEGIAINDSNNPTKSVSNIHYLMLNPAGETHLYQLESSSAKDQFGVVQYYFSRGTGELQKLNLLNVKNAFAGDLSFQEALDAEFKTDEELTKSESLPRLAALFEILEERMVLISGTVGKN